MRRKKKKTTKKTPTRVTLTAAECLVCSQNKSWVTNKMSVVQLKKNPSSDHSVQFTLIQF